MITLTIKQTADMLTTLYQKNLRTPMFLWGSPGIGKSSVIKSVTEDLGIGHQIYTVADRTPAELRGLPQIVGGLSSYAIPDEFPREGKGILFFDEMNQGSPMMMAIAQRLLLDRKIGDYEVPDGWMVAAAGNRATDQAAVFSMPRPVANRLLHVTVEPVFSEWKDYAISFGLDGVEISEDILGYLNFSTHQFHPSNIGPELAFPTPRSWANANQYHANGLSLAVPGLVGQGAGNEFLTYLEIKSELPDIDSIIAGEKVAPIPKAKKQILYAAMSSLALRSLNHANPVSAVTNSLKWILTHRKDDFTAVFCMDVLNSTKFKPYMAEFMKVAMKDPDIKAATQALAKHY